MPKKVSPLQAHWGTSEDLVRREGSQSRFSAASCLFRSISPNHSCWMRRMPNIRAVERRTSTWSLPRLRLRQELLKGSAASFLLSAQPTCPLLLSIPYRDFRSFSVCYLLPDAYTTPHLIRYCQASGTHPVAARPRARAIQVPGTSQARMVDTLSFMSLKSSSASHSEVFIL